MRVGGEEVGPLPVWFIITFLLILPCVHKCGSSKQAYWESRARIAKPPVHLCSPHPAIRSCCDSPCSDVSFHCSCWWSRAASHSRWYLQPQLDASCCLPLYFHSICTCLNYRAQSMLQQLPMSRMGYTLPHRSIYYPYHRQGRKAFKWH